MAEAVQSRLEIEDLQQNLSEVQALLRDGQRPGELRGKLDALHPADIAYVLEALPPEERLQVWDLVKADRDGEILVEVSDAARESLIEITQQTPFDPIYVKLKAERATLTIA